MDWNHFLRKHAKCASSALLAPLVLASSFTLAQTADKTKSCRAESAATVPAIVELYTSEGCNSCPPADKWLSRLVASGVTNVIPLAFHVDYWDYIGWKDAYAKAAYGERQGQLVRAGGTTTSYTPQVFVNGRDDRSWYAVAAPNATAPSRAKLTAEADWSAGKIAITGVVKDSKETLRVRYALTENGITTAVKAGENRGETLAHDAVVREHAITAVNAAGAFSIDAKLPANLKRERSQLHVIAETLRGEAVAAVTLKCGV